MEFRFCNICNSSIPQDESAWIRPCQCRDSEAEVHRHCLLADVQMKEERGSIEGGVMYCRLCGVRLNVVPDKGSLVRFLEAVDRKWYQRFCEVAIKICTVVLVDVSSATLGLLILYDVYGKNATRDMVLDMHPVPAVYFCQTIFFACIILNSLNWEEALLQLLRRCSNIPVIGRIFPLEDNSIHVPDTNPPSLFDCVTGGFLLPAFAGITGNLLFYDEPSQARRLCLGGAVFILLRGFLKAYYKQKLYVRESCLTVANYSENTQDNIHFVNI